MTFAGLAASTQAVEGRQCDASIEARNAFVHVTSDGNTHPLSFLVADPGRQGMLMGCTCLQQLSSVRVCFLATD